jgi:hypothetical protein
VMSVCFHRFAKLKALLNLGDLTSKKEELF